MRHAYRMPFGAEYRPDSTRFRLWAPSCPEVGLALGREGARELPMEALADGWHELDVAGVRPGEEYAFRVKPGARAVADPASRSNPRDVNGPSVVVDPRAYEWRDDDWRGRPWHEAVIYELHVGTFTPQGTFAAAIDRLEYLREVGVTAIELMPVADFAGRRGWGYDGVLHFAPDAAYGPPGDLKRLIDAAHGRGLMVLLDVVYNHFGPEGNYLHDYARDFFNDAHQTPWGSAINFDGERSRTVREFFIANAAYWVEEYRFDGLRLDAIHAIADDSPVHVVEEIARELRKGPSGGRYVHLVLENDRNQASLIEGGGATAQWNDDAHHALHVLLTGETDGYYVDYVDRPAQRLARTLAEGFDYQGEPSKHRNGEPRGEPSSKLSLTAFIPFLQNHDQVGNRAMGERLSMLVDEPHLRLAEAILLLAPSVPMLFMGEEFAARTPFLYFCDFGGELARAVREGRRREFASFARFASERAREAIPDPGDARTFEASRLDWSSLEKPEHARVLAHTRTLIALRAQKLFPRLALGHVKGSGKAVAERAIAVDWTFGDGSHLALRANLGDGPVAMPPASGDPLHAEGPPPTGWTLAPWSAVWRLA